jgi:cystathionine gamma-lyase
MEHEPLGDLVPPVHVSSTFVRDEIERPRGEFNYSRSGNPTTARLEQQIGAMADATHALTFSSGMAAIATVAWTVLEPGDHLLALDSLYGGTRNLFEDVVQSFGVDVEYVDATDPSAVTESVRDETALIWLESPSNPLLKLCDVEAICDGVSERNVRVAVDNTFATPYFQKPLELGADLSVHSTTKYLNGHSDVVGGAVCTDDESLHEDLHYTRTYGTGANQSARDAQAVSRGLKTFPRRMDVHETNARQLASFLADREEVDRVYYPGLETHPQHELARSQMSGFGGMLSFELDGDRGDVKAVLEHLDLFQLTTSLGGVESLIAHVETMTHDEIPAATREEMGLSESLVRISTGIEDAADLVADLDAGLSRL